MSASKVMLLGEIGVGKSSIVQRLVFDRFETSYKPTIGVDIYRYETQAADDAPAASLIIWDTDGNFGDAIFRHVYIRDAAAALIVADVMRPETFTTADRLCRGFKEALPGREALVLLNKSDLLAEGKAPTVPPVLTDHADKLLHTSAKSGTNIEKAFYDTAAAIQRRNA